MAPSQQQLQAALQTATDKGDSEAVQVFERLLQERFPNTPQQPQGSSLEQLNAAIKKAQANGDAEADAVLQRLRDERYPNAAQAVGVLQQPAVEQAAPTLEGEGDASVSTWDSIKNLVTGADRETEETRTLDDWTQISEGNQFNLAAFKAGLGTLFSGPDEIAKIIQAQFPDVQVRKDAKGNTILRSAMDGKEYAIKPGFRTSDIPGLLANVLAFTPAGRALRIWSMAILAAATQGGIEGLQAALGGDFNLDQVGLAGGIGGAGAALGKTANAVLNKATGGLPPADPAIDTVSAAKTAAGGFSEYSRKGGAQALAASTSPDPAILDAAERLGVKELLQPDHVTTNQVYREIAQTIKTLPGSQARASEKEGLELVAKKADEFINDFRGTTDLSELDYSVKTRMQTIQADLDQQASRLYDQVDNAIPATTKVEAKETLAWLEGRVSDLGGISNLTAQERKLYRALAPRVDAQTGKDVFPTYALLDNLRKEIVQAKYKRLGPFKDVQTGSLKKLETHLLADQRTAANKLGVDAIFDQAQQATALRKSVEKDMTALYGNKIAGSMLPLLSGSVKSLSKGDASKFISLIKAIPENMREEVVVSGMATAFGRSAKNEGMSFSQYADWYKGLQSQQAAYTALMAHLPKEAQQRLKDLYRVSEGIRKAAREHIPTGRMQAVREQLDNADTLLSKIYGTVIRVGAYEAGTSAVGYHGAGLIAGLLSGFAKNKTASIKAADELIASPEFIALAMNPNTKAAKRMTVSKAWKRFAAAMEGKLNNPEQWLLSGLQAARNQSSAEPEPNE